MHRGQCLPPTLELLGFLIASSYVRNSPRLLGSLRNSAGQLGTLPAKTLDAIDTLRGL